jgi:hypothetical protein
MFSVKHAVFFLCFIHYEGVDENLNFPVFNDKEKLCKKNLISQENFLAKAKEKSMSMKQSQRL